MSPGLSVAHYRITAKLGEGGMGEVWRASATKLGRDVAIKILPAAFAQDPDRMARFTREARVLASLNHPNIAAIYGVEDQALVMELVEGETLPRGLPLERALNYARQIAEALEYAHERGVVHRDLKPSNIKVTPEGRVKVLDFGLAKAVAGEPSAANPESSPTLTMGATVAGVMLGTPAYMAPEQARGQAVDRRADIWAFGAILYEMLTGGRLFAGDTVSDTLASVLKGEIDLQVLPAEARPVVERCLRRDPKLRWRSIGDVFLALEEGASPPEARRSATPWIAAAAVLVLALAATAGLLWRATRPVSHPLLRFTDDLGMDVAPTSTSLALSPDGTRLAFVSSDQRLFLRYLNNSKPAALSGTEGANFPFFSPDGRWIGFFAAGKLKKVSVQGGAPIALCDVAVGLGASWGEDGAIFFAPNNRSGLLRVAESGGAPEPVTRLDPKKNEQTHRFPQALPGARAVLFTTGTPTAMREDASIEAQVLKTGERKTVYRGGYYGRYLPGGYLVYLHQGTFFAAPMDLARLELTGSSAPILDDVSSSEAGGSAGFDYSRAGTLAYLPGASSPLLSVAWLDASGKFERMSVAPKSYLQTKLSPDGTRLAVVIQEGASRNLWVYDWKRDRLFPITFGKNGVFWPAWSPDGKHLAFMMVQGEVGSGIYWARADGGGQVHRLLEVNFVSGISFSPDARRLAFGSTIQAAALQTVALDFSDPERPKAGKPETFPTGPGHAFDPNFSPDGRWMAYVSDESGGPEVYVEPSLGPGGKWLVSSGIGSHPVWSSNGRELFYEEIGTHLIQVVTYTTKGDSFEADPPRVWVDRALPIQNTTLSLDGKRFAIVVPESGEKAPTHVVFLLNFFDELRRRVPAP
jgi:serine/threonine-protein kinase